jgi:hypothetical protein
VQGDDDDKTTALKGIESILFSQEVIQGFLTNTMTNALPNTILDALGIARWRPKISKK